MDYFVLTVASLILFAATFFSTVTGFGFALIAAPVLTMVMGPKETVTVLKKVAANNINEATVKTK